MRLAFVTTRISNVRGTRVSSIRRACFAAWARSTNGSRRRGGFHVGFEGSLVCDFALRGIEQLDAAGIHQQSLELDGFRLPRPAAARRAIVLRNPRRLALAVVSLGQSEPSVA
jgi:hypothetical protein